MADAARKLRKKFSTEHKVWHAPEHFFQDDEDDHSKNLIADSTKSWQEMWERWDAIQIMPATVKRNLMITMFYNECAVLVRDLLNERRDHGFVMNWLHFGAWASNTVGFGIRSGLMSAMAARSPCECLPEAVAGLENAVGKSIYLAFKGAMLEGNHKVFQDVGEAFCKFGFRFAEGIRQGERENDEDFWKWARKEFVEFETPEKAFRLDQLSGTSRADLEKFRPWLPSENVMGLAMKAYYDAVWEDDSSLHHEYCLLGNMYIALVEQMRLEQPLESLLTGGGMLKFSKTLCNATTLGVFLHGPAGRAWVWKDVPPHSSTELFVPTVAKLRLPQTQWLYANWVASGKTFDQLTDTLDHTGAVLSHGGWQNIIERMKFIYALFRTCLTDKDFEKPLFTHDQREAIMHFRDGHDGTRGTQFFQSSLPVHRDRSVSKERT